MSVFHAQWFQLANILFYIMKKIVKKGEESLDFSLQEAQELSKN